MLDMLGALSVNPWDWGGIYDIWRMKEKLVGSARLACGKG